MLLLALGILYLLNNTGVIDASFGEMFSTYWPLIIVIFGLKKTMEGLWETIQSAKRDSWRFSKLFWGLIITAAGMILLGNRTGWFYYTFADLWSWTWPLLVIFIGFQILWSRDNRDEQIHYPRNNKNISEEKEWEDIWEDDSQTDATEKKSKSSTKHAHHHAKEARNQARESRQREHHSHGGRGKIRQFIGEVSLGKRPWKLADTDIHTTIGSVEVDLTTAILKDGENYLDINVWIGSVEVTVLKDMAIKVIVDVNIGDANLFNDGYSGDYISDNFEEAEQKVILHIRTNIGSVEVMGVD